MAPDPKQIYFRVRRHETLICLHVLLKIVVAIIVLQGATVGELKKAIERHIVRKHRREGNTSFISW